MITDSKYKDSTQTKNVLLEYFTGHRCGNCPSQSKTAFENIASTFKPNVKIIKIHAGFFAEPKSSTAANYRYDFRNTVGDKIYQDFGVTSVPIGMVNRKNFSGLSTLLSPSAWVSQVDTELKEPASYGIWQTHSFDETSRKVSLNATVKNLKDNKLYAVTFNGSINADWNTSNCYIIVVVESIAGKSIAQAIEFKLTP